MITWYLGNYLRMPKTGDYKFAVPQNSALRICCLVTGLHIVYGYRLECNLASYSEMSAERGQPPLEWEK